MATLTNEFQKVIETSTKVTQNVTGYLRLYLRYGNRSGLKDTIYYEIRQYAYNPYGNYLAWQWDSALAWSIKQGNTNLASGSYTQSAIYSDGKEVVRASGSFDVTHDKDGTWEKTLTLNGYVYTTNLTKDGLVTLPKIIVAPKIAINGSGSTSTNRATLSNDGASVSVTLSDTNSELTTIEYSTNNSNWNTLLNTTGDDTLSLTIPSSLLSTFPTNKIPTIYLRARNSKGNSSSVVCYLNINLAPNISKVEVVPISGISTLDNNKIFVKNISKPKITTTATAPTGTTISSYNLTSLGGYSSNVELQSISNPYTYNKVVTKTGTFNAKIKVTDKRTNSASKTSANFTIIDYANPTFVSTSIERCNENGQLEINGTYGKLTVDYKIAPIKSGTTNYNTKKLEYSLNKSTWYDLGITNYSGTKTQIIGGTFAPEQSYTIYLRLTDLTTYTTQNIILPSSEVTISKRAGGKGVTFGRIAEEDGFNVYMDADFKQNLKYKGKEVTTIDDTGWIEANLTSDFHVYRDDSVYAPKYRRFMKIVEIRGHISPTKVIDAGDITTIFTLPVGFRPSMQIDTVQQGSITNKWDLRLYADGRVTVVRYGTTSAIDIPTTAWLPFTVTFLID